MTLKPSSGLCLPRFATPRRMERETLGPAAAAVAEALGQPLMPWQRMVVDVGLELLPDGRPAYREVGVTIPRQNGKTTLQLAVMGQRALGWGVAQRILYSAQTGNDARRKLVDDWSPALTRHGRKLGISRLLRGMGNESVEFRNGSRIVLLASSEDSGHGKTVDLAVHDEIFADIDDRREQATIPAMATRPLAQMWWASTQGTEASVFLNRKVDAGRQAVAEGATGGIAYFEWAADLDADIDDPATWFGCMPALGYTINEDVVAHARRTMPEGEFRRAFLNQPTTSDERVIPVAAWAAAQDPAAKPDGALVVGFDVAPDLSRSSVAVSDGSVVELIEAGPGVGWAVRRAVEVAEKWRVPVALDPAAAAGTFVRDFDDARVDVIEVGGREFVQACGSFFDVIVEGKCKVRPHVDLDAAVGGAAKRIVGDAWAWTRRNSDCDITPLVAVTIARWAAATAPAWQPLISS